MWNKLLLTLNTTDICTTMNSLVKTFVYRQDCDAKDRKEARVKSYTMFDTEADFVLNPEWKSVLMQNDISLCLHNACNSWELHG